MKKRILSMLLALLMVFSLLPVTALADEETENLNTEVIEETTEMPAEIVEEQVEETDPAVAAILARIGALPDPADFPTMTKGELQAVLDETNAIFDLYDALTPEQQGQIDLTPLYAMYDAESYLDDAPVSMWVMVLSICTAVRSAATMQRTAPAAAFMLSTAPVL